MPGIYVHIQVTRIESKGVYAERMFMSLKDISLIVDTVI
jgi:hypothetical protein